MVSNEYESIKNLLCKDVHHLEYYNSKLKKLVK